MMIEDKRKRNANDEQNWEDDLLVKIRKCQRDKINQQNKDFSSDDIRHNRSDKESFFTLEDRAARRAAFLDIERTLND